MNPFGLDGKVALITGSGRGIGATLAGVFAQRLYREERWARRAA